MDIWSSSSLRRKNLRKQDLLGFKAFKKLKNTMTTLQSNIHYNTVTIIHVNPSIMNISVLEENKMEEGKLT
jgi:hypothetical protein